MDRNLVSEWACLSHLVIVVTRSRVHWSLDRTINHCFTLALGETQTLRIHFYGMEIDWRNPQNATYS